VHPVQLYEAVLALVLAVAILALVSRDKLATGNAFMAFALGYGALRILADLRRLPGLNALYGLCTTVIVLSTFFVARSWQKPATVRRGVRLARPQ
jgi:prolipoprotein diacylglyceryltransferase